MRYLFGSLVLMVSFVTASAAADEAKGEPWLRGRLLLEEGDSPMAGARVTLHLEGGRSETAELVSGETDTAGTFRLAIPASGIYSVELNDPKRKVRIDAGYVCLDAGRTYGPVTLEFPRPGPPRAVEAPGLAEGGTAVIRAMAPEGFRLETAVQPAEGGGLRYFSFGVGGTHFLFDPASATLRVVTAATRPEGGERYSVDSGRLVEGVLTLASGAPCAECDLTVALADDEAPSVPLKTKPDGTFRATVPRGATAAVVYHGRHGCALNVIAAGDATADVRLAASPCRALEGKASDSAGVPWAGLSVEARYAPAGAPGASFPVARTAADRRGMFRLEVPAMDTGSFLVAAAPPTYETATVAATKAPDGSPAPLRVTLPAPGGVVARATLSNGSVPPCVRVSAVERGVERLVTFSTPEGFASLRGLRPGTWDIRLRAPGMRPVTIDRVGIEPGKTTDLGLVYIDGGSVSGVVRDAVTGGAIATAPVRIMAGESAGEEEAERVCASDTAGRFRFPSLPAGVHVLSVRRHGYDFYSEMVELRDRPLELDVELEPLGSARGSVNDIALRPVGGAVIQVYEVHGPEPPMERTDVSPASTDAEGLFLIEELPAGQPIRLRVTHPSYAVALSPIMTLDRGERREGIALTVEAAGEIRGRVAAKSGEPVERCEIGIHGTSPAAATQDTTTDAAGAFVIGGLPEGTYDIEFSAEGYLAGRRTGFKVKPGETTGPVRIELVRGARITGRVTGKDDPKPVSDAMVSAVPSNRGPSYMGDVSQTDDQGRFVLENLDPAAVFTLTVRKNGYARREVEGVLPDAGEIHLELEPGGVVAGRVLLPDGTPATRFTTYLFDARSMMFPASDFGLDRSDGRFKMTGLAPGTFTLVAEADGAAPSSAETVVLREAESVDGVILRLRAGLELGGRVIDETGQGVAGARIMLRPEAGAPWLPGSVFGETTGEEGKFEIAGLSPGRYRLEAEAAGVPPVTRSISIPDESTVEIRIREGVDCRFRLVELGSGKPVESAELAVMSIETVGTFLARSCTTRTDGACVMTGLFPGRYLLAAQNAGDANFQRTINVLPRAASKECEFDYEIERPGSIVGRIAAPPAMLRGAAVNLIDPSGEASDDVDVDADGGFSVYNLVPGLYRVFVHFKSDLGQQVSKEVEVTAGAVASVSIEIRGVGEIFGRVLTAAGGPVPGLTVDLSPEATLFISEGGEFSGGRTTSSPAGAYRFPGLDPAIYRVTALNDLDTMGSTALLPVFQTVDLREPAAPLEINLVLPPGSVRGRAIDAATGQPVPGADVNIMRLDGKPEFVAELQRVGARTGPDGHFGFEAVPADGVRLTVMADGYQSYAAENAPSLEELRVQLKPTGSRSLTAVLVPGGQTPDSLNLLFLDGGENPLQFVSLNPTSDGTFVFMDPGAAWLWLFAVGAAALKVPTATASVELPPGGAIGIEVSYEDGRPVPGARVSLTGPQGEVYFDRGLLGPGVSSQALTDGLGTLQIDRLLPGSYNVVASGAEGLIGFAEAGVVPGPARWVAVTLSKRAPE